MFFEGGEVTIYFISQQNKRIFFSFSSIFADSILTSDEINRTYFLYTPYYV
jgi:hypothetical protein